MLQYQGKLLRKALSMLLTVALFLNAPIGIRQAYAREGNLYTGVDRRSEQPIDTSWVAGPSKVLGSGNLQEKLPAPAESGVNMLAATQTPVWPEGSTITVKYKTQTEITINWTQAQGETSVVDYIVSVYQGSESIVDNFFVGTIPGYTASELSPGMEYRFDIQAMDVGQYSEILSQTFRTSSVDGNEPPFWTDGGALATGIITPGTVELLWAPALDDKGVTDYKIYQDNELIASIPGTTNKYEAIGLLPSTDYTFKVEAVDNEGLFTTDGPEITITTKPGEGLGLRFNTSRKDIYGHLFMGDKIGLEFISMTTGLKPVVTVSYKEWNAAHTSKEEKTSDITLVETQPGSKKYNGDFELAEGICEVNSLEGKSLKEAPDEINLSLKVAGRLKVEIQETTEESELAIFKDAVDSSTICVYRASGGGRVTTKLKNKGFTVLIEGLSGAEDYMLQHYNGEYSTLYQTPQATPIKIQAGLETVLSYKPEIPAYVRVRVLDGITGEPIQYAMISGIVKLQDGKEKNIYGKTGEDGYAVATVDSYFSKNVLKGSKVELTVSHIPASRDIFDWYTGGKFEETITSIGDNDVIVKLNKLELVTLKGTVIDCKGDPMKNVHVSMPHPSGSFYCNTDKEGKYSMELPKIGGSAEISFSESYSGIKNESLTLGDGINILDVQMPVSAKGKVLVTLNTTSVSGVTTEMDINPLVNIHMRMNVKNTTTGKSAQSFDAYIGMFNIEGNPGDIIEISADGEEAGYSKGMVTAVLDKHNFAEATLELKQYGRVKAYVTDEYEDILPDKDRYIYIYKSEDGSYVSMGSSYSPNIASNYLPVGNYRAVISWVYKYQQYISGWENSPGCIITDSFLMVEGKDINLGTQTPSYSEVGFTYFKQNRTSGFTSSHKTALPGTIVTLRVAYDYDNIDAIDRTQLDLVADIPIGTELIKDTVIHKITRGGNDIKPVIGDDSITIDLIDRIESAAGSLTYQVRVSDLENVNKIRASAELKFNASWDSRAEKIGVVSINTKLITLNAPLEIAKSAVDKPIKLSGLAPAGNIVELYDGDIKIGEAIATPTGLWSANVLLPDRGTPIFHTLMAKAKVGIAEVEHSTTAMLLVGADGAVITELTLTQGSRSAKVDPRQGEIAFPFVIVPSEGNFLISVAFDDFSKVNNVKISGYPTTRQDELFIASIPWTTPDIIVEYDEKTLTVEDILKYDHGQAPPYMKEAEVKFTDETKTEEDVKYEFGEDGYLNSLDMPEIKITMLDDMGSVAIRIKAETADFDPANAKNRTDLGGGMYGYDFNYELVGEKYVITAYLDRRLLQKPDDFQADKMINLASANTIPQANKVMNLAAATTKLDFIKATMDVYSAGNKVAGAFGDAGKSAKLQLMLSKYDSVRPNMGSHMVEYYDSQIQLMSKDALIGKSLGLVGDLVGEVANLVPVLGQVVVGVAGIISDKMLGDMYDNEFELDYNRLMTEMSNMPGGRDAENIEAFMHDSNAPLTYYDYENDEWRTLWFVEKGYTNRRNSSSGGGSTDNFGGNIAKMYPKYIYDPSGYVYEAVEDNRIVGVTTTVLYLPKDKAADATAAKASTEWEFWNAEWYLQKNPQITDVEGRYAWDVPEGWWMVQFVKDGYQTTYSDALPVPPPQLDVNVPMVKLDLPEVDKTVWASGGRYVDIYFSKYMDISVLELPNAVSIADDKGALVLGTVSSAVYAKTGVKDMEALNDKEYLNLTKLVRFTPSNPLEEGNEYNLTVNKTVTDYAGFSMEEDFSESESVSATALIKSLSGKDIEVESGKDITLAVKDAVSFMADDPAIENSLDKRLTFVSSHDSVVKISDNLGDATDVKIVSIAEGVAEITATSVDDSDKSAKFSVTVKYPSMPIGITHMTILDANGKALTTLELREGDTCTLKPNLFPENTTQRTVSYSSDNEQVATISASGVMKAVSKGIAIITVGTENPSVKQKIHITVLPVSTETGHGGGVLYAPSTPTIPAANGTVQVEYTTSNGTVTLSLPTDKVNQIIEKSKNGEALLDISKVSGVTAVQLPKVALKDFSKSGLGTTIKLPTGTFAFDEDAAASVAGQASGSNVTIDLKQAEAGSLTIAQKEAVKSGNNVLDINIYSGTKKITGFDGTPTIQVPYIGSQPVAVWSLNEKGEFTRLKYTFKNDVVSFGLTLLSIYVVGQDTEKPIWINPFIDVNEADWFYSAVSFCAKKGITNGTSATTFSPNAMLTRGQFITMLLKAYSIEPVANQIDNFDDAGSTYYTDYIAAAKAKGISNGVGGNKFAPEKGITRQEMFTLLYNALKLLNKLPAGDNGKTLDDFTDSNDVANWATEGMTALVESGTVVGFGGELDPTGGSTRAQMSEVLYNLLDE